MRAFIALAVLLPLACGNARAITIDAKALARFDVGYARCEARYPHMQGHRDEAWLGLWRVKADEPTRAQLAAVRKRSDYQSEKRRAAQAADKSASSPETSRLEQQCQALWAETQRTTRAP